MSQPAYEARIQRAELLTVRYPFASEVLKFYIDVAAFQRGLSKTIPATWGGQPLFLRQNKVRSELNLLLLLPQFADFLEFVRQHAPVPLSEAAASMKANGQGAWIAALDDHWTFGGRRVDECEDAGRNFLCRAFLEPFSEMAAQDQTVPTQFAATHVCPLCEARPVAGVLRPEGDGGKRFLLCSFCGHEWEFRRILCAACGEEREGQLQVFVAEEFPHIRMECCDTCRHFLRTVDLTREGNAVPVVDDLAAIPLGLWAEENEYARIERNLLGT